MTDLRKLRELAEHATSGPWSQHSNPYLSEVIVGESDAVIISDSSGRFNGTENAAFIAAASPSVVLSMLDALDAARAEVERVRGRSEDLRDAMSALLDAHAQQGATTWERALDRACLLVGRYCDPYVTLQDPNEARADAVFAADQEQIDSLRSQLAAMTEARDELADMAEAWAREAEEYDTPNRARLDALRQVGREGE